MKRIARWIFVLSVLFAVSSCVSSEKSVKDAPTAPQEESAAKKRAKELVAGERSGGATSADKGKEGAADSAKKDAAPPVDTVDASDLPSEPSPEELKFLDSYLASLKYMVYYDEKAGTDPQLAKTAVAQANRYLIEKMNVQPIDFEAVEKKKADERSAYQAETGNSMDYIQFIAQKLNADIYAEISFATTGETNNGKYYCTVSGSMKLYNASTGDLLGSIALNSPKTVGPSSDQAATYAVTASVWMAMPKMTDQAKTLLKTAWRDGIRYDVVFQNTQDAKKMSQLKRQLGKKIRKIQQDSFSAQETRWSMYSFKRADDMENTIYDAADAVGLRDVYLVYQRGKSFVFNTGL
jgi:hypothetical protein